MTTTRIRSARPRHVMAGRPGGQAAVVAAIAGGVTLLVRLALHVRGFDLYGDEVIYTDLGRSVISGGLPRLGVGGQPVFHTRARLLLPRSGLDTAHR